METQVKKESTKDLMWNIIVDISWANLSTKYFGRSRSWLSQKMNGKYGNGGEGDFSPSEKQN